MPMLGQTITVVNKSGKVVRTSKHLVNVFNEAKSAYRERKAELKTSKDQQLANQSLQKVATSGSRPASARNSPPSPRSVASSEGPSRHGSRQHRDGERRRERRHKPSASASDRPHGSGQPPLQRGFTDSFYADDRPRQRSTVDRSSPLKFMEDAENEVKGKELVRRRSFSDLQSSHESRSRSSRRRNSDDIDMDLAYGELPPPLPARNLNEQSELKIKVTALQRMLEEADCLQHSATAMIKSLENNPDAMAAVALTMAEISNIVTKVGPGALAALKGSFPAVVALLASPEFLIAAGVGVGITVIALGGYKIVKRIKAKKNADREEDLTETDELEELGSDVDVNRIENWRRGIADVETASIGTSVDGEFITPGAAKELRAQGKLPERKKTKKTHSDKKKDEKAKEEKKASEKEAKRAREKKEKQEKQERKEQKVKDEKDRKERKKAGESDKRDSGLAMILKGRKNEVADKDLLI